MATHTSTTNIEDGNTVCWRFSFRESLCVCERESAEMLSRGLWEFSWGIDRDLVGSRRRQRTTFRGEDRRYILKKEAR